MYQHVLVLLLSVVIAICIIKNVFVGGVGDMFLLHLENRVKNIKSYAFFDLSIPSIESLGSAIILL